jgi:hypothetical protein
MAVVCALIVVAVRFRTHRAASRLGSDGVIKEWDSIGLSNLE